VALDELDLTSDHFPTLWSPGLGRAHCVVPDGFDRGQPFGLVDWQAWALLNFYRLKAGGGVRPARAGVPLPPLADRRPQKAARRRTRAAHVCLEGVGPALFAGWARAASSGTAATTAAGAAGSTSTSRARRWAAPWPTPLIQITAFSEEQTDNIYSARCGR
jgi:hypothetical protein